MPALPLPTALPLANPPAYLDDAPFIGHTCSLMNIKALYNRLIWGLVLVFAIESTSISQVIGYEALATLPAPSTRLSTSTEFSPARLAGLKVNPRNPFQFDFLVHQGDVPLNKAQKKQEYERLIKYFLASLTVPDADQWVNLSPYEGDRMIAEDFGKTAMGGDLLAQDYLLKQITSSLMYPEGALGKKFWDKVYAKAQAKYGPTNVPVNTFNKVWIMPDKAEVYESGNTVYLLNSHLKVMLEEDYMAIKKNQHLSNDSNEIIKEIILPELEREVNEGKNFAALRQIMSGMILATWYKQALKSSLLGQEYADQAKVRGIDQDPKANQAIYDSYIKAFKKGAYNYIKEEADPANGQMVARKYFAGGIVKRIELTTFNAKRTPSMQLTAPLRAAMAEGQLDWAQASVQTVDAAVLGQQEASSQELAMRMSVQTFMQFFALAPGWVKRADRFLLTETGERSGISYEKVRFIKTQDGQPMFRNSQREIVNTDGLMIVLPYSSRSAEALNKLTERLERADDKERKQIAAEFSEIIRKVRRKEAVVMMGNADVEGNFFSLVNSVLDPQYQFRDPKEFRSFVDDDQDRELSKFASIITIYKKIGEDPEEVYGQMLSAINREEMQAKLLSLYREQLLRISRHLRQIRASRQISVGQAASSFKEGYLENLDIEQLSPEDIHFDDERVEKYMNYFDPQREDVPLLKKWLDLFDLQRKILEPDLFLLYKEGFRQLLVQVFRQRGKAYFMKHFAKDRDIVIRKIILSPFNPSLRQMQRFAEITGLGPSETFDLLLAAHRFERLTEYDQEIRSTYFLIGKQIKELFLSSKLTIPQFEEVTGMSLNNLISSADGTNQSVWSHIHKAKEKLTILLRSTLNADKRLLYNSMMVKLVGMKIVQEENDYFSQRIQLIKYLKENIKEGKNDLGAMEALPSLSYIYKAFQLNPNMDIAKVLQLRVMAINEAKRVRALRLGRYLHFLRLLLRKSVYDFKIKLMVSIQDLRAYEQGLMLPAAGYITRMKELVDGYYLVELRPMLNAVLDKLYEQAIEEETASAQKQSDVLMKEFGVKLRRLREVSSWSLEKAAQEISITTVYLKEMEEGLVLGSFEDIEWMAQVYRLDRQQKASLIQKHTIVSEMVAAEQSSAFVGGSVVARRLAKHRMDAGLSLGELELALRGKYPLTMIVEYEMGKSQPGEGYLYDFGRQLGMRSDDIRSLLIARNTPQIPNRKVKIQTAVRKRSPVRRDTPAVDDKTIQENNYLVLGGMIRRFRTQLGMTPLVLGNFSKLNEVAISELEAGVPAAFKRLEDEQFALILKNLRQEHNQDMWRLFDAAMRADELGGIDMNGRNMELQIRGADAPDFTIPEQGFDAVGIEGLVPHISEITTATQLPIFSELQ